MSLSQVHLAICSSFLSLANKAEFLDLGYVSAHRFCVSPPLPTRNPPCTPEPPTSGLGSLLPGGWTRRGSLGSPFFHTIIYKTFRGWLNPF